jgi:hypothetical protein
VREKELTRFVALFTLEFFSRAALACALFEN